MEKIEKVRRIDPSAMSTIEKIVDDLLRATEQEAESIRTLYIAEIQKLKKDSH